MAGDRPLAQDESSIPRALRGASAALPRGGGRGRGHAGRRRAGRRRRPRRARRARAARASSSPARAQSRWSPMRTSPASTAWTRSSRSASGWRRRTLPRERGPTTSSGSGGRCGLDRAGTVVALGGGTTTDLAGFAAATYMRGVDWVAVPTTLVGQVDAAIGGKTAIDLPEAKNLVGAFHWPARTVIDPALLATLPERSERAQRHGRGGEDGPARRRGALGAGRRGARAPVCGVQGRALPARSP